MKRILTVLVDDHQQGLVRFLARCLELPEAEARRRVEGGSVYLDRRRERDPRARVATGQRVTLREPDDEAQHAPIAAPALVYLDEDLVALEKPPGMPSIPTRAGGVIAVSDDLRERFGPQARLLHRLDRAASGLLLASRSRVAQRALARQLADREIERAYFAVVVGDLRGETLSLRRPLAFAGGRAHVGPGPGAKAAQTDAQLVRRAGGLSLLHVTLGSGRTHQIRAHLADAGLPLVGDAKYGGPSGSRLALHAHRLGFEHPRSGQRVELHSPLPQTLRRLLAR